MPIRFQPGKNRPGFRTALVVLLWLAVMGTYFFREILPSLAGPSPSFSLAETVLPGETGEDWMGIFYGGEQVGYAHTFFAPAGHVHPAGIKLENTILVDLPIRARTARVRIRTLALIDGGGEISRLSVAASSSDPPLELVAEMKAEALEVEINTGGQRRSFSLPLPRPALPAYLIASLLPRQELSPGDSFSVPVLDPLSGITGEGATAGIVRFRVIAKDREGYRLRADLSGMTAELDLDPDGRIREIATHLGWTLKRQSLEEVTDFLRNRK